jgi:Fe-S cluster biosynthesis and repair protein YggX
MNKMVDCVKLKQKLPGMAHAPYPNALGQKIQQHVSQKAWSQWLAHQTMLINEYQLNMIEPKAKTFLLAEAEKFFFGEGSQNPEGYQAHTKLPADDQT